MKFCKLAAMTGIAVAALSSGARAEMIDLGGFTGPIEFKFANYESFTSSPAITPGSMNFGVVEITNIINENTGANIWVQGQGGQFLSGVFNGITVNTVTPGPGGFVTTNTGGVFNFYLTSSNFDPSQGTSGYTAGGCGVGGLCYNGITNAGGTDILNLALVPGTTTDPTNTLNGTVNSTTLPLTGSATAFADITGGADTSQFGTGGFSTNFAPADFHILNDFCTNGQSGCAGPTSSDWQLFSNDPVFAMAVTPVVPIPEPASLSILAGALLGLGMWGRRRRVRPS